ncbi:MAG: hypothetical protein V1494_00440 [Candidatus Diapherotrites archaeon]
MARKKYKLNPFFLGPVREKAWAKKINHEKPGFVITGELHRKSMMRRIKFRTAIKVMHRPPNMPFFIFHIGAPIAAATSNLRRAQYKLHEIRGKIRRRRKGLKPYAPPR